MNRLHRTDSRRKAEKGGSLPLRQTEDQPQTDVAGQIGPVTQIQVLRRGNPTRGLRGFRDSETQRNLEDLEDCEESPKKRVRKGGTEDQEQVPFREPEDSKDKKQSSCRNPEDQKDNEDPGKTSVDLPLEEYTDRVHCSYLTNPPEDYGDGWKSETWEFVRLMKRHPLLRNLNGSQAANLIPWHVTGFDEDEQFQIVDEWDEVRYVAGEGPLNKALLLAVDFPVPRKSNLTRRFNRYADFLSFAGWLQMVLGNDAAIYLPQRKVAGIFGCDRSMVYNLTREAIKEGYLTVVAPHTKREATRYKFHLDKFPGHFRSGKT